MSDGILRLSLCAGLMACLAGCGGNSNSGGGGGGGGGNPTIVTYTFTDAMPTAVATQIGTGAYTLASVQSGTLTISVPDGTSNYSIAWVCPNSDIAPNVYLNELVFQRSTADGTSFKEGCSSPNPQTGLATLQVNAAAIAGAAEIMVGQLPEQAASGSTLSFSGQLVTGTHDVAVVVYDVLGNALAVRILRSQTIPGALNGGNPVVFAASDETVSQTVSYTNVPAGFSNLPPFVFFLTSGGAEVVLNSELGSFLASPSAQYPAMPAGAVESGDYYIFSSNAYANGSPQELISAEQFTASGGAVTLAYPAPWAYSGPTAASLPTFSLNYTGFSGMSSVSQFALIQWHVGSNSTGITVFATENYQNGATSITIPNLSGLSGFSGAAPSGTNIYWAAGVQQGSISGTPPSGSVQSVQDNGNYLEP
jgi:hypothetical protein